MTLTEKEVTSIREWIRWTPEWAEFPDERLGPTQEVLDRERTLRVWFAARGVDPMVSPLPRGVRQAAMADLGCDRGVFDWAMRRIRGRTARPDRGAS